MNYIRYTYLYQKPPSRKQHCSRCGQAGHNASSKRCVWLVGAAQTLGVQVDDAVQDDIEAEEFGSINEVDEVTLNASHIDDLLNSSDENIF